MSAHQAQPALPPLTEAHLRAAHALFAWPGLSFEAAMQMAMRRRFIELRARAIRKAELRHNSSAAPTPRQAHQARPSQPLRALPPGYIDHKRAAAGDTDD